MHRCIVRAKLMESFGKSPQTPSSPHHTLCIHTHIYMCISCFSAFCVACIVHGVRNTRKGNPCHQRMESRSEDFRIQERERFATPALTLLLQLSLPEPPLPVTVSTHTLCVRENAEQTETHTHKLSHQHLRCTCGEGSSRGQSSYVWSQTCEIFIGQSISCYSRETGIEKAA